MDLTQIMYEQEKVTPVAMEQRSYDQIAKRGEYGLFCEQYLERPVISGDKKMAISPTACTIKGIPVIDDF